MNFKILWIGFVLGALFGAMSILGFAPGRLKILPTLHCQQIDSYPLYEGWIPHRWAYLNLRHMCPLCGKKTTSLHMTSAFKPSDCFDARMNSVDARWTYSPCGHEIAVKIPCRTCKEDQW